MLVYVSTKDGFYSDVTGTYLRGALCETPHPSYQAWTYAALLQDFNEAVYDGDVTLQPCAYLHNCSEDSVLNDPRYRKYTKVAPVYLKQDSEKLSAFSESPLNQIGQQMDIRLWS